MSVDCSSTVKNIQLDMLVMFVQYKTGIVITKNVCSRHDIADELLTWRESTTIQSLSITHTYVYAETLSLQYKKMAVLIQDLNI